MAGHCDGSSDERGAACRRSGCRWGITSAVLGMVLWLTGPFVPIGAPPSFGSIEHTFVFVPLVAAPLALLLLSVLVVPDNQSIASVYGVAQRTQPVAAAMVLASFFMVKGTIAGVLAAGWLVVTVLIALGGGRRAAQVRAAGHLSNVSLLAAHVFLPVGAVWLLLSRLGIAPRNLTALTVFLAALHFHFSGFTLQVLIGATGLRLPRRGAWMAALHRGLTVGAVAGIPMIAAGNILRFPVLKFLGVSAMVLSTLALAIVSMAVASNVRGRTPRFLVLVSAVSIAAAMALAGVYGVGELIGSYWIGIPRMAAIHGLLNALGFTLCGLLGYLHLRLVNGAAEPPPFGCPSRRAPATEGGTDANPADSALGPDVRRLEAGL